MANMKNLQRYAKTRAIDSLAFVFNRLGFKDWNSTTSLGTTKDSMKQMTTSKCIIHDQEYQQNSHKHLTIIAWLDF